MKRQTAFEKWVHKWYKANFWILRFEDESPGMQCKMEIAFKAGFRAGRAHTERLRK